jgi:O-antigen/teichoic acid export membrane protein
VLTETESYVRTLLVVFALALLGRAVCLWTDAVFRAYEATYYTFQQEVLFRVVEMLGGLTALWMGGGPVTVAVVYVVLWWLQGLIGLMLVRRRLVAFQTVWPWRTLWPLLRQGMPILGGVVLMGWLMQGPLVLYRHSTIELSHLGDLSLVMQVLIILTSIPGSAISTLLPVLSRVVTRQDNQAVFFVNTGLRVGILVGGVLGLIGLGLGEWVVSFFLGSDYAYAGKLLGIGLWLCIPWLLAIAMWQVLLAHGYFSLPSLALLGGAVVMTSLLPTLVTLLDAAGALLALGLGVGTWLAGLLIVATRLGQLGSAQAIIRPAVAVLISLGIFLAFKQYGAWLIFLGSLLMLLLCAVALPIFTSKERAAFLVLVANRRALK